MNGGDRSIRRGALPAASFSRSSFIYKDKKMTLLALCIACWMLMLHACDPNRIHKHGSLPCAQGNLPCASASLQLNSLPFFF